MIILCPFLGKVQAQKVDGSWYGKADAVIEGTHNNYLTELVLKQKGNQVEGIFGYYFRNGYQSYVVKGTYDKNTRTISIREMPVVYFRENTIDGVECMMHFMGTLRVSKVGSSIRGSFMADPKYQNVCPELRVLYSLDTTINQEDEPEAAITRKFWQPAMEDKVVVAPEIKVDKINPTTNPLIEAFKKRASVVTNDVAVAADSVRVSFYDNGDVDGDTISVFLNGAPIVEKQMITARAINVYIKLDPTKEYNEISMFAENLGRIPPNTALMVVYDGTTWQEVYLTSNLSQNGTVRIRRKK